ncbi:MAG: hypothetical protein IJS76_00025 [Pseudobutyrivibrio sp.]|nr:hypothetical protein [Pseudobutyrivibrio sp.]
MKKIIYKITLCIIPIALFIGCSGNKVDKDEKLYSKADILVDETTFPDTVFREYIEWKIDLNNDMSLSADEIENVKKIVIDGQKDENYSHLKSISGISYFFNLQDVRIMNCLLSEADFSENKRLTKIVLMGEGLTSINISENGKLEELTCFGTDLSEIDIKNNKALKALDITGNDIGSLDVSQNTKLEELICDSTKIKVLDISNNKELVWLSIGGTKITSLNLTNANKLEYLCVYSTAMSEINLAKNPELLSIYCQGTNIQTLDLSNNPKVYEVECNESTKIIGEEQLTLLERFPE